MKNDKRTTNSEADGKRRAAFTIIELLVVICIIAILLGIALPNFLSVKERARQRKAIITAKHLELAFSEYYNQNQGWPNGGVGGEVKGPILGALASNAVAYFDIGTNTIDTFRDPWNSNYYMVAFDADFDNQVVGPDGVTVRKSVIVWNVHDGATNKSWE